MDPAMFTALCSLAGTLLGSGGGILVSMKMTNYRLDQLEKRVTALEENDKRLYKLEEHNTVQDTKMQNMTDKQNQLRREMDDLQRG